MRLKMSLFALALFVPQVGFAELNFSENFTVLAPPTAGEAFPKQLLEQAEAYRREIAREWFGQELAGGAGKTTISFTHSSSEDKALTWARSANRKYHVVYLTTSTQRALGSTLKHEMVHVVFATQFPGQQRLPLWLEEGIASRYDDGDRIRLRANIVNSFGQQRAWPNVTELFQSANVSSSDQHTYAFAASLTEYLLTQRDRSTLVQFGATAKRTSATQALAQHYRMRPSELQHRWQHWVTSKAIVASRQATRR